MNAKIKWQFTSENARIKLRRLYPSFDECATLEANPDKYKALNPPNGFGRYEDFIDFCRSVLHNCYEYPDAVIEVSA